MPLWCFIELVIWIISMILLISIILMILIISIILMRSSPLLDDPSHLFRFPSDGSRISISLGRGGGVIHVYFCIKPSLLGKDIYLRRKRKSCTVNLGPTWCESWGCDETYYWTWGWIWQPAQNTNKSPNTSESQMVLKRITMFKRTLLQGAA